MGSNSTRDYLKLLAQLTVNENVTHDTVSSLMGFVKPIYQSDLDDRYSKPMLWIGLYIALASLVCIIAMAADLVHGLRSRRLWFPCKYFSINSTSLMVISVAMKLPVDLSGSMPGDVDQVAKLGSLAFMCTMMANLLPCLATMDNDQLWTNIIALGIQVITLVVNVCIQIQTGVISYKEEAQLLTTVAKKYDIESLGINKYRNTIVAITYVTSLLFLLMIHVCSSLAILKSKQVIESKYQQAHETASKEVQQSTGRFLTVEKLQQHVSNYWIMASSGSPQFIIACSATTTASGVICAITTIVHTVIISLTVKLILKEDYDSDYKWSTLVILIVQFIGILLGTVAPVFRCFATISFKVPIRRIWSHMNFLKVESYWTQKLYDWKHVGLRHRYRSHTLKVVINTFKNRFFNYCIEFQLGVVVACKILASIPFFFMICVLCCLRCLKWLSQAVSSSSGERTKSSEQSQSGERIESLKQSQSGERIESLEQSQSGERIESLEQSQFILRRQFVLQHEVSTELAERTKEGLYKSINRLFERGQKKQPKNLNYLIESKSSDRFEGVKKFDTGDYVPWLPLKLDYQDCWSLPVVTLTTIAITLPNIEPEEVGKLLKSVREGLKYVTLVEETVNEVDKLLKSVREGLKYVTLVEETVNAANDYASVQKAAERLWQEVDVCESWLGDERQNIASQVNASGSQVDQTLQIVQLFMEKAKQKINKQWEGMDDDDLKHTSICAYSMCRIAKTIIDEKDSHSALFGILSSRIADIMAACLTNLPKVIAMRCHNSAIEKREESVRYATQLLGETRQTIHMIQARYALRMDPYDRLFIDKWRAYLSSEGSTTWV